MEPEFVAKPLKKSGLKIEEWGITGSVSNLGLLVEVQAYYIKKKS